MSGFSVSARHSFSGGCGNTRSITRVRGLSAGLLLSAALLPVCCVAPRLLRCSPSAALLMGPSFPKGFQTVEAVAPEGAVEIEPVHHRRQRVGPCAIVSFASVAAMPYQLCSLQHREVLGDSRLGDARIASQCVDGLFALPGQHLEEGPASRVGKSTEHVIGIGRLHTRNHNRFWLWFVKRHTLFRKRPAWYQLLRLRSRQRHDGQGS
jgi:hypothetical protein